MFLYKGFVQRIKLLSCQSCLYASSHLLDCQIIFLRILPFTDRYLIKCFFLEIYPVPSKINLVCILTTTSLG